MTLRPWRTLLVHGAIVLALLPAAWAQEQGTRWSELSPAQRGALAPLEHEWGAIDPTRKQKWLDIAERYPRMAPADQERLRNRMSDWARLSPAERGQARLNFQAAREVPSDDRRARWEQYQSLSPEERSKLAARAEAPPARAAGDRRRGAPVPEAPGQAKSNIVPNPSHAAPPRAVAPSVVQSRPGATTTLMSERRAPPAHQQAGLPKIAATPGFVDSATLQPQRGPQGAAAVTRQPEPKKSKDDKPSKTAK